MNVSATDASPAALESLHLEIFLAELNESDEVKCESAHLFSTCSVKVVSRITSTCEPDAVNLCANATRFKRMEMAMGIECAVCSKPVINCWKIIPI